MLDESREELGLSWVRGSDGSQKQSREHEKRYTQVVIGLQTGGSVIWYKHAAGDLAKIGDVVRLQVRTGYE